jgi:hypothetical protein
MKMTPRNASSIKKSLRLLTNSFKMIRENNIEKIVDVYKRNAALASGVPEAIEFM